MIFRVSSLILMVMMLGGSASGQTAMARASILTGQAGDWASSGTSLLDRPANTVVENARLADALDELGSRSGVPLAFSASVLPAATIDCACNDATVAEALKRMLADTQLGFKELHGQVVVFPVPGAQSAAPAVRSRWRTILSAAKSLPVVRDVFDAALAGTVVDAETGQPLEGAQVDVRGSGRGAITDARGRFRLEGLEAGSEVRLRVTLLGYTATTRTVRVGATDLRIELQQTAIELEEIVATGTATPSRIREMPTPVRVVTASEIADEGVHRIDDLFDGAVPGLYSYNRGNWDLGAGLVIRGNSSLDDNPNEVPKVYIDGVPVPSPGAVLATMDPSSVERIEVISGPQAAGLYGAEARNGVIQIFTAEGQDNGDPHPQVSAKVSSGVVQSRWAQTDLPLTQDHSLSVSGGADAFSYRLATTYRRTGEWTYDYQRKMLGVSGNMSFSHGPLDVEASGQYATNRSTGQPFGPERNEELGLDPEGEVPWVFDARTAHAGARATVSATPDWLHTLTVGFSEVNTEVGTIEKLALGPLEGFQLSPSTQSNRSIRYETSYELEFGPTAVTMLLGGERNERTWLSYSAFTDRRTTPLNPTFTSPNLSKWSVTGYFGQARLGLSDDLFVTGILRAEDHDNFGGDYGLAWTPSIGTAYNFDLGGVSAKIRADWGKAIEQPSVTQTLGSESSNVVTLENTELGPEEEVGWEAGIELYFGNTASASITRYDQTARNLINYVDIDAQATPSVHQYQNVGEVENRGWELEGSLSLGGVGLRAAGSLMESTVRELYPGYDGDFQVGDGMLGVPDWTGSFTVSYKFLRGSASFTASVLGERTRFNQFEYFEAVANGCTDCSRRDFWVELDPFTRMGLRIEQSVLDDVSVFGWVDNLANNQETDFDQVLNTQGRTIVLGARVVY